MDTKLYNEFLFGDPDTEIKKAHLDPGEGFIPQASQNPVVGKEQLPLYAGADMMSLAADPLGSWTGLPKDPLETPEQDADDL